MLGSKLWGGRCSFRPPPHVSNGLFYFFGPGFAGPGLPGFMVIAFSPPSQSGCILFSATRYRPQLFQSAGLQCLEFCVISRRKQLACSNSYVTSSMHYTSCLAVCQWFFSAFLARFSREVLTCARMDLSHKSRTGARLSGSASAHHRPRTGRRNRHYGEGYAEDNR